MRRKLRLLDFANPASMSIREEPTITAGIPMLGVFHPANAGGPLRGTPNAHAAAK